VVERQRRSGFQFLSKRLWWRRFASGEAILYINVKGLTGRRAFGARAAYLKFLLHKRRIRFRNFK
jgi:hypothetical protein